MRTCIPTLILALIAAAPANAAIVASEDFEAGATGWTDNKTETPGANSGAFTRHLGRHGAGATTSKTFALSGTQSIVNVSFDWYRLDSWDGEQFFATITDGTNTSVSSSQGFFFDGGPDNIYNPSWTDRKTNIAFGFATTASAITLTFSSTLDQDFTDESWGVDNLMITDNSLPGGVPEPSTWAMMILGFGVMGSAMRRRAVLADTLRKRLTYA
ncbi:MAG: PEP-CTERM sorting domain-containing protein [Alphaproteobacteria bacterium]|nr:MAG: PEP-CTERM sorting domain-containing protein [Alphaproteobacteria bacterium]